MRHYLKTRLRELAGSAGDDLFSDYTAARKFVTEEVVEHIAGVDSNLTDHGPRHLADVMSRVMDLLSVGQHDLTPQELFILCVSLLFHDVGNLHGRKHHERNISGIYAQARGSDPRFKSERNAVLAIAGAHTGSTVEGSLDTLKVLDRLSFQGTVIRSRELAAILRLADELAEGEHRTSAYLRNIEHYSPDSAVYHAYAEVTEYSVQAQGSTGRIAITYTLDIEATDSVLSAGGVPLDALLQLCYKRIVKLDQERRYCGHYCPWLRSLAETSTYFHFYYQGVRLSTDLESLVLSDLVIPGTPTTSVEQLDVKYVIQPLLDKLKALCAEGGTNG